MNETNESRLIMIELGKSCPDTRVFRNNTGMAYQSNNIKKHPNGSITLFDYRVIYAGLCVGSSDLIGLTSIVITPDMVGKRIATFTAIEVKSEKGVVSGPQQDFMNFVTAFDGIAGVARSPQEAVDVIKKHPLLSHGL